MVIYTSTSHEVSTLILKISTTHTHLNLKENHTNICNLNVQEMSWLYIFSISKVWNELYKPRKKRKTSLKPLAPMDGRGIKDLQMWWRNEQELLSPEPKIARNKWAEWLGRGEREGDKRAKAFCPGWRHQPGQKDLAPFPLPPPEPFSSLVSCCSRLGREEFLLISSPHLWRSLIPRSSIGAKGLGLVFLFFLGLYTSFHALEIEKMCS